MIVKRLQSVTFFYIENFVKLCHLQQKVTASGVRNIHRILGIIKKNLKILSGILIFRLVSYFGGHT